MDRTNRSSEGRESVFARGVEFAQAELEYAWWLASRAPVVAREDGPVAVASRAPDAIRDFVRTVGKDFQALFGDSGETRRTWERKDGRYSPEYYAMFGPNEASDRVLSAVTEYVDEDASILEIGCSSGRHLSRLHEHGYADLYGVEINEEAIAVMEKAFPDLAADLTVYERPIQDLVHTFDDGQFDVVYTVQTLELIPPDDSWMFEELRRVADELIITVENEGNDEPGVEVLHIEDFPLYLRNWREIIENEAWTTVDTEELEIDTFRAFRPRENVPS